MDVWLFICMSFVFLALLQIPVVLFVRERIEASKVTVMTQEESEKRKTDRKYNRYLGLIFPGCFVLSLLSACLVMIWKRVKLQGTTHQRNSSRRLQEQWKKI